MDLAGFTEHAALVIQVGPITLKKGEHFDAYLKNTMERRHSTLDQELANLKTSGKNKSDPEAYCRKFYEASLYPILPDKNKAQALAANLPCDCLNEHPDNISELLKKVFAGLKDWDWSSELAGIRTKGLIIHGVDDTIPVESSKAWAALNKNSRLMIFDSSGHLPFAEEPELLFRAVKEFISEEKD